MPESSAYLMLVRSGVFGVVVGLTATFVATLAGSVVQVSPAHASTNSEVTVTAADYDPNIDSAPMPNLSVTVSQTTDLVSQGISVSWTGAEAPSVRPSGTGGENFLQIFQCWGDDPENPGHPDRTTCQYGGFSSIAATRDNFVSAESVDPHDEQFTVPGAGYFQPPYTSIPFRSVGGESVSSVKTRDDGTKYHDETVDPNSNQFFTEYTTNEVKWAGSGPDGAGSVKFETQTVMESPGLGCGTPILEGTSVTGAQSCWLVIVPRGTSDNGSTYIERSGLLWDSWQHHVAVKLDFRPVGVRCDIGSAERQVSGSELISQAIALWQPKLCLQPNGSAFVVLNGNEEDALFRSATADPGPLALTSRPMADVASDTNIYAPVAVSGVALTFNIDRRVRPVSGVPLDVQAKDTTPFDHMKLTPRLVAKLLTSSYISSLPGGADLTYRGFIDANSPGPNASNLTTDPDFLAINDDEWQYMDLSSPALADALMPQGRSDLAYQLWRYVLSDPDAVAFLNGAADPWGMTVNPWYLTTDQNSSGVALALPRTNFPKADPIEKPSTFDSDPANGSGAINLVTWRPYTSSFENGAYLTLRSDGQVLGAWNPSSVPPKYGKRGRYLLGEQKVLSVTTTGAAAKYENVAVELRNPAGNFVAPDRTTMQAAVSAMTPTANSSVYEFNFSSDAAKAATNAYPLTMPVYAALNPLKTDATQRAAYASFIRYAVQDGQIPGNELGQLPPGYSPIPASWVTQSMNAASVIQAGIRPTVPVDLGSLPTAVYNPPIITQPQVPSVAPTGKPAGALSSSPTPQDPAIGAAGAAVPIGAVSGLLAAGAVPIYTRWRRNDV